MVPPSVRDAVKLEAMEFLLILEGKISSGTLSKVMGENCKLPQPCRNKPREVQV